MVKDHRHQELDVVLEDRSLSPEASTDQQAGDAPNVFKWIHVLAVIGLCTLLLLGVYHGASRRRLVKDKKDKKDEVSQAPVTSNISQHASRNENAMHTLANEGTIDIEGRTQTADGQSVVMAAQAAHDAIEDRKVTKQKPKNIDNVMQMQNPGCQWLCVTKDSTKQQTCLEKGDNEKNFRHTEPCTEQTAFCGTQTFKTSTAKPTYKAGRKAKEVELKPSKGKWVDVKEPKDIYTIICSQTK